MPSRNSPSRKLRPTDREILRGGDDIQFFEPDQIFPAEEIIEEEETSQARLQGIRASAEEVSDKIEELKQKVDARCSRFKVVGTDGRGSRLFQAMVRVFKKRTETVTYNYYKRALELREELAKEQREIVREEDKRKFLGT